MPRIKIRTNTYIAKDKKLIITEELKKVIDTIPYEVGKFLMTDFEDEQSILFGENPAEPCCSIEINVLDKVYDRVSQDILEKAMMTSTAIVSNYCNIPTSRIFTFFQVMPLWAYEGINIEKSVLNLDE